MPQFLALGGAVLLAVVPLGVAMFVVGWRARSGLVLGPIIWFSKQVINPRQLRSAGTPGAYAGIIRHRGRLSGTEYETPVGIVEDAEAIYVALPYGSRAQWLRNVLAAGSATIVNEGRTVHVDRPELISLATVASRFSAADQRLFRVLRVDECLRLHVADRVGVISLAA